MHNFPVLQIHITNYIINGLIINVKFCLKTACDEKSFFQTHMKLMVEIEFLAYISSNIIYYIGTSTSLNQDRQNNYFWWAFTYESSHRERL